MGARYREYAPAERLRPYVECFWSVESDATIPDYPVLPDGCVDIVYSPAGGLRVVGAMTRVKRFRIEAGETQIGLRFLPAMAVGFVGALGSAATDQVLPLGEVWGAKGLKLSERVAEGKTREKQFALLEAELVDASEPGTVQRVAAYILERRGQVRVDDLAFDAGMSARQLRRLFVEEMGLTPKHFCRVIRFQHSVERLRETRRGDWTEVALDCGYYDQAHFINDFREFSGYTPGEFAARPR